MGEPTFRPPTLAEAMQSPGHWGAAVRIDEGSLESVRIDEPALKAEIRSRYSLLMRGCTVVTIPGSQPVPSTELSGPSTLVKLVTDHWDPEYPTVIGNILNGRAPGIADAWRSFHHSPMPIGEETFDRRGLAMVQQPLYNGPNAFIRTGGLRATRRFGREVNYVLDGPTPDTVVGLEAKDVTGQSPENNRAGLMMRPRVGQTVVTDEGAYHRLIQAQVLSATPSSAVVLGDGTFAPPRMLRPNL